MRWPTASAVILGLATLLAATTSPARDTFVGGAVFGGGEWESDPVWYTSENFDWRDLALRPVVGWRMSERWDLWVEGVLGYVDVADEPGAAELGAIGMTSYDLLAGDGWSLFGELGAGLGWASDTPDRQLLDRGLLGFFDYGLGLTIRTESGYVVRIGPRFHHRSSLFRDDAGMNSYGVMFSVTK